MSKEQALIFILVAEKIAHDKGDIIRECEIRADYILFCRGFYDHLFKEGSYEQGTVKENQ